MGFYNVTNFWKFPHKAVSLQQIKVVCCFFLIGFNI